MVSTSHVFAFHVRAFLRFTFGIVPGAHGKAGFYATRRVLLCHRQLSLAQPL